MLAYQHFGGRHGESAAIRNVLAFLGVVNPQTKKPLTEAMCFGIAGGIGAGYSFCPSIVRHGMGSGVSIIGRHKIYATDAAWYQDFADRVGFTLRTTETAAQGKAFANLQRELADGRPTIVYCSRMGLPFLDRLCEGSNMWMHSFVLYGLDEASGVAYGGDRAPTKVTISLTDLANARAGVCSHKNRTVTFDPPKSLSLTTLQKGVRAGIRACMQELLVGRMKTFSLPGLLQWSKCVAHEKSKDGWLQIFGTRMMYDAFRDVYETIETNGTGGGAYRYLYADFLAEAAEVLGDPALTTFSVRYRALGEEWTRLAEAFLPTKVKPFKKTRDLLKKKCQLFEVKGEAGAKAMHAAVGDLQTLERAMRSDFPLSPAETKDLLQSLSPRIAALHDQEHETATALQQHVG